MLKIIPKNIDMSNIETIYPRYSICTLVNDEFLYEQMVESFVKAGFVDNVAEYLYISNIGRNIIDGYGGINIFLTIAKGRYIILCHQDIVLEFDRIEKLEKCISQLNKLDPNWALLGNAGGVKLGKRAIRITSPNGANRKEGDFPSKVQSLDENFILVRKDANLGTSKNIFGFHCYGLDLCLLAMIRGYSAYVVDFHLRHLSNGRGDSAEYHTCKDLLIKKYNNLIPWKYYQTTHMPIYLSQNKSLNCIFNSIYSINILRKYYDLMKGFKKYYYKIIILGERFFSKLLKIYRKINHK